MRSRLRVLVALVVGSALFASSGALAQQSSGSSDGAESGKTVEGVIVDVRDDELIVDLGTEDGLPTDATVEVFRRLEVTHPVTDKEVSDRFPIGEVSLDRVGRNLSIVTTWNNLKRAPSVGDYAVWEAPSTSSSSETEESGSESDSPRKTVTVETSDQPAPPERSPARKALESMFQRSLGQSLDERISLWERYLEEYPDSPFAKDVSRELEWLRERVDTIRETKQKLEQRETPDRPGPLEGDTYGPGEVRVDDSLVLTTVVDAPSRVERIRALVRRAGDSTYETIPMRRAGDHNWRIALDDKWLEPGNLEYFVEVIREDGGTQLLGASASEPDRVAVVDPVEDPASTWGRSRATGVFEYVNFNAGDGTDEFLRFEADYRYELDFGIFEAFSVGTGIFNGTGASVSQIETGGPSRDVTVSYGYAEAEFAFDELFAVSARLLAGNHTSEDQRTLNSAWGSRVRLRMGEANGTRLIVGGALTEQIGNEAWITFATEPFDRVPMRGEALVTNLPVGSDLGVSLNYGVGYRLTDWLTVSGRVGWNARKIDYQGPSAGLATQLDW